MTENITMHAMNNNTSAIAYIPMLTFLTKYLISSFVGLDLVNVSIISLVERHPGL